MDFNTIIPGDYLVTNFKFGPMPYQHWSLVSDKKCKNGFYMLISASERTGTVKEEPIEIVVQGGETTKTNLETTLTIDEIIKTARSLIGQWEYSVSKRNCEHFVNYVSGLGLTSSQVKTGAVVGVTAGIATTLLSEKPSWFKVLAATLSGIAIGVASSKATPKKD